MKYVSIVGIGLDGVSSLTAEARREIENADMLIGAARMLGPFEGLNKPCLDEISAGNIASAIEKSRHSRIAVLMSGDVGFYSGASSLMPLLTGYETRLIPGVSSVSAFFARIKRPWQAAKLLSLHGRETDIVAAVRRNTDTFCITGGNVGKIAQILTKYGFGGLTVYAGERLGYEDERISTLKVEELIARQWDSLCVLLILNEDPEAGISFGIDDSLFIRGEAPMTKAEVRAVTLSKLRLSPTDICYDVGAGTGSVTIEMALSCYKGKVYAIEREAEGASLIELNAIRHRAANIEIINGSAPGALYALPSPDAVFIGGAGGNLDEIVKAVLDKNMKARIVINAVTLETLHEAVSVFKNADIEPEVVQISVSKAKKLGNYSLMTAQNPVFVISGGGPNV